MYKNIRIAMWSGPRNISTALMRSFENRTDAYVTDEPFYAYFLKNSGEIHPAREQILKVQSSNWDEVSAMLTGNIPKDKNVWYQKHMAHHVFDDSNLEWTKDVINCFLIREPKEVINSYIKRFDLKNALQLGYSQQLKILNFIKDISGKEPIVMNAKDVLMDPETQLRGLCERVGVDFTSDMLSWPLGTRDTDGVWAPHWYSEVEKTTGFQPYTYANTSIEEKWSKIYESCLPDFELLNSYRMKPQNK